MTTRASMTPKQVTLWWCHYRLAEDAIAKKPRKSTLIRYCTWLQASLAAMSEAQEENPARGVKFDFTPVEVKRIRRRGAAADRALTTAIDSGTVLEIKSAAKKMVRVLRATFAGAPQKLAPTGNETRKP